jgi:hypothetical protein
LFFSKAKSTGILDRIPSIFNTDKGQISHYKPCWDLIVFAYLTASPQGEALLGLLIISRQEQAPTLRMLS